MLNGKSIESELLTQAVPYLQIKVLVYPKIDHVFLKKRFLFTFSDISIAIFHLEKLYE